MARSTLTPGDVCHHVRVDTDKGFTWVGVSPDKEYRDPSDDSFSLWEYKDQRGDVRACLLRVAAGRQSPTWRIKPEAAAAGYYEMQVAAGGLGYLVVGRSVSAGGEFNDLSRPCSPVRIDPGNTFAAASPLAATAEDTYVLAVFPGAPFQSDFEERVSAGI
jgi:hypothetical protein